MGVLQAERAVDGSGSWWVRHGERRFRVVVYRCFGPDDDHDGSPSLASAWSGFVESPFCLLGFAGLCRSRREALLACFRLLSAEVSG